MKNLIDIKRILKAIVNALHALKLLIDEIPASGGGGGIDYSTTEQDTGIKWIDGRPIYQITLTFESPFQIPHGDTGYTLTSDDVVVIDQPLGGFAIGRTSSNKLAYANLDMDKPAANQLFMATVEGLRYTDSVTVKYLKTVS